MISFTSEEDKSKQLNFLDITVTNNCKGHQDFEVDCKNVITNIQIKFFMTEVPII